MLQIVVIRKNRTTEKSTGDNLSPVDKCYNLTVRFNRQLKRNYKNEFDCKTNIQYLLTKSTISHGKVSLSR